MSLPYRATVLVNWLPVICMPSPESPAKRMTARSITSGLVFGNGISVTVDIFAQVLAKSLYLQCAAFLLRIVYIAYIAQQAKPLSSRLAQETLCGNRAVRRACKQRWSVPQKSQAKEYHSAPHTACAAPLGSMCPPSTA